MIKIFKKNLKNKLLEEAQEVASATSRTDLLEELADLQEVVNALCDLNNIDSSDLAQKQKSKREKAGGFKKKLMLIGKNGQLFSE
ncbi:nucleoside triphosphate pyrophosphohydrolase [Candidatus Woesebacteria bacterium]|nr:nucleoside triphosphate pyrophosphohydrolase [Candidatus Woesebacteria bacterium]